MIAPTVTLTALRGPIVRPRPFLAAALALAACGRAPSAVPAEQRGAWEARLIAERAATDAELKSSPTSAMAGAARFGIPAASGGWVVVEPSGVTVVTEPVADSPLAFAHAGGWTWTGTPERAWREGDTAALVPGPLPEGALFRVGRFTLAAYAGGEALVLIAFDPERPELRAFERLRYFPPDDRFDVTARRECGFRKFWPLDSRNCGRF